MKRVSSSIAIFASVALVLLAGCARERIAPAIAPAPDLLAQGLRGIAVLREGQEPVWQDAVTLDASAKVALRVIFPAGSPRHVVALALDKPLLAEATLNGQRVPPPIEGMRYSRLPGIPPGLLVSGENTLLLTWPVTVRPARGQTEATPQTITADGVGARLFAQSAADLAFQSGPILGCAGPDAFTVTCRTNMPAAVTLETPGRRFESRAGLMHSFRVEGLRPGTEYAYTLAAVVPGTRNTVVSGPHRVATYPTQAPFMFAILGDSRTHPEDWAKVGAAVAATRPLFSVFVGDMVAAGRTDSQWDDEYLRMAPEYFATIPYYAVIGNHEQDCPLLPELFPTPGGGKNWVQQVGPALLIGIDGAVDWSPEGQLLPWLQDLLARSTAPFIIFVTHYPPWTSGPHGALRDDGLPKESTIRVAQQILMPLLEKHRVTAVFAGHDHNYERSDPPGGVTVVVTGGAGAPMRDKTPTAEKQNPHSKVFAKQLHYCLLTVDDKTCTMKVYTPEGEIIDQRVWNARPQ